MASSDKTGRAGTQRERGKKMARFSPADKYMRASHTYTHLQTTTSILRHPQDLLTNGGRSYYRRRRDPHRRGRRRYRRSGIDTRRRARKPKTSTKKSSAIFPHPNSKSENSVESADDTRRLGRRDETGYARPRRVVAFVGKRDLAPRARD